MSQWYPLQVPPRISSMSCGCRSPGIPGIGTGPLLFVTRHTGQKSTAGGPASRMSIYCATSGMHVKEICCSQFKQANMMALA